jgi:hypothetical protein
LITKNMTDTLAGGTKNEIPISGIRSASNDSNLHSGLVVGLRLHGSEIQSYR